MASLNIAERRLPQDGRIKLAVRGKDIDLRVSTMPTMHGEALVLRMLDRGSVALDFTSLGFEDAALAPIARRSAAPTASSWSPARRAAARPPRFTPRLIELNTPDRKILTVEDPIEYQLDGVNQVQSSRRSGSPSPMSCAPCCAMIPT